MKKSKALFVSTMLASLALTSCGTKTYHGTYQFQMGKANGSHIGIYMDLTKDTIKVEGKENPLEKFNLKLSVPTEATGDEDSQSSSLIGGLLTYFADGLEGGYAIEKMDEEGVSRLVLSPVININAIIDVINGGSDGEGEDSSSSAPSESSSEEPWTIPSEIVDEIMIAKYQNDTINVTIPVSLTDLMLQLYWYGFDIFDLAGEVEIPAHEHGTHPTEEDVKKINETFNKVNVHHDLDAIVKYKAALYPWPTVEFRDFNQLTMTLKRAEKL